VNTARDLCPLGSSRIGVYAIRTMPPKLIHYLRNERRETGLTQADIAALLGAPWKSKVSRYERREALPPLETALGYEAVMRKPVSQLFAGMYASVAAGVRARARDLLARSGVANTALRARRKRTLERILQ
jgi:transcriptional regulator with XRE-family HTH domain